MKNTTYILLILAIIFTNRINSQNTDTFLKANIGHTDVVTDFDLSNNNKYLATCSEDKSIILWDFTTQKEIKTITGHKNSISCIDINSSNTQIVTGESGKDDNGKYIIKIWDIKSSNEIRTIKPKIGRIKLVNFTDDDKFLYVGGEFGILYYDLETGSLVKNYIGSKEKFLNITLSDDKKFISASTSNKIFIWDINKREILKTIENTSSNLTCINLDKNGNKIITGGDDNSIRIYNTISGNEEKVITVHRYQIYALAIDKENKYIASSDKKSKEFKIIDINTGNKLHSIEAHKGRVGTIKISNNNQFVITLGSWDRKVKIWNILTGELIKTFEGINKNIYQHAYIDSLKYYSIGKYRNNAYINYMSKHLKNNNVKDKNGEVSCIALSNNKKLLAYGTSKNNAVIYSAITNKELHKFTTQKSWIRKLIFSNNNKYLATASYEQLKIWNVKTGEEIVSIDKKFKVPYSIAFSKNNKLVAVGCKKSVQVFNIETGKLENSFKAKETVTAVDFSYNNSLVAIGEGNNSEEGKYKLTVYNLETKKSVKSFSGHTRQITSVKFSSDDKNIASSGNTVINIWNFETEKLVKEIKAHARWINDINYNKDNTNIISTSQDGTVKIWDMKTGNLLLTEIGFKSSENWISYTPDGRFNGTTKGIETFYFIKNMEVVPLENLYEQFYTPKLTALISKNNIQEINIANLQDLPKVEITKPIKLEPTFRGAVETLLSTNKKTTNIAAKLTDMGGGLNEVRVYQNNKLIYSDKLDINKDSSEIVKDYEINLAKGLNIIEVAGYNNDRTKQSKKIGIEYTGSEFHPANLYVFAIGINNYKKPTYNLNYAVSDATSFATELSKNSNKIFKNTEVVSLLNENATKENILAKFNEIKEKCTQNDVFVFYYAGHGSMSASEGGEKSQFHLIPWEITNLYNNKMLKDKGISASDLRTISEEIKAEKQLFVLDACQSGGAVEFLASRGSEEEKAIAQLAHSTGTYFITASGSQQLAGEFGELGHGVFTYAVLEAFKGKATKNDKKLTVRELTYYVEEQVPILSEKYKGSAQYPASYGFGQDFPLLIIVDKP